MLSTVSLCNAGIPYGFDFVSMWIEHVYGTGDSFGYRLTLDILNLLTVIDN